MWDFMTCVAIEQGAYLVGGAAVALIIAIIGLEWFCVRLCLAVLKDGKSKLDLHIAEKFSIKTRGTISALAVMVVALGVAVAPLAGVWYLYDRYDDYYAVGVDARGVDTLESVRAAFATEPHTHVTVSIADNIKDFPIRGDFRGACVADLFDAICRVYSSRLVCRRSYSDRTVTIDSR